MPAQTRVNLYPATGVPGDPASVHQTTYWPETPFAGEGGVIVGNFCWLHTDGTARQNNTGAAFAQPLGIVERIRDKYLNLINSPGTLVINPDDLNITVTAMVKGDAKVISATAATIGQAVFANTTNGSISTAAPGGTVASSIETLWRVARGGEAGDTIIISNWMHAELPAAATP